MAGGSSDEQSVARPEPSSDDPRVKRCIAALRLLAARKRRALAVQDYLDYRAEHAPTLPALTTLYRLFGSFGGALEAAGIAHLKDEHNGSIPNEQLLVALRRVAKALMQDVLSTHAYDEYRRTHEPTLPSSSLIRKRYRHWDRAVEAAGLQAPQRAAPRRPTAAEAMHALRRAAMRTHGPLTPQEYARLVSESEEEWPQLQQIMVLFPSWDAALRAADIEQADDLHPHALWTVEEARRIARSVQTVLGETRLTERRYEMIRAEATRPMPTWQVLTDLLSVEHA
jgi:hypothetical protein